MSKTPVFRLSLLSVMLFGSQAALAQTPQQLGTVEVKGVRTVTQTWKTTAERNVGSMRDVMTDSAEIGVGGGSTAAQYLSIRGAGQNRIDLTVDGTATATQVWYHQGRFQLDPAMIKVIGLDKGAGAASAGIGVTSGRLRAETVSAKELLKDGQEIGARIGMMYNSNNGFNSNLAVFGQKNGFDGLLMGSWINDRTYEAGEGYRNRNSGNEDVINSARKQANYLAKIGFAPNADHHFGISYRQDNSSGVAGERAEFAWLDPLDGSRVGPIDTTQHTTNITWRGKNMGFVRNLDVNVFNIKVEDDRFSFNGAKVDGTRHSTTDTTGANVNLTSTIFQNHSLKYGVNYRHEETESENQAYGKITGEDKTEYGVYLEGIWSFDPVTLTTGVRYDHFDLTVAGKPGSKGRKSMSKGSVNPSIAAIWDISPNFSVNAKLNYATRSPSLSPATTLTDNRGSLAKARGLRDLADNLKVERARLAEVGFEWKTQDFALSGSVYEQEVKNFYSGVTSSPVRNLGTLKTTGYELTADYQWNQLNARVAMAYAKPKPEGFALDSSALDVVPQGRQWRTSLTYQLDDPNLELGWRGRFAESKEVQVGKNTLKRQGYGVHDLFVNWKPFGKDDLNVNFAVNNVADKLYWSHSQRSADLKDANTLIPPNPGREFRIGVNYQF